MGNCLQHKTFNPLNYILKWLLIVTLILLQLAISLIGFTYRCVVYIILRCKHGTKFRGFMDGNDRLWAMEDISRSRILILAIFECDDNHNKKVFDLFAKQSNRKEIRRAYPKILMKRKKFMGYDYFFKPEVDDNYVVPMRDYDTVDDLQHLLGEYVNEGISFEDDGMIEVIVGSKPITWVTNGKMGYPLVIKLHHSMGDGVSLMNLFLATFADEPMQFIKRTYFHALKTGNTKKNGEIKYADTIFKVLNPKLHFNPMVEPEQESILHGAILNGLKSVAWKSENGSNYIEKVKRIKKRLNCSFNNVVLAAVSASFNSHFQKHKNIPNCIRASMVVLPMFPELDDQVEFKNNKFVRMDMTNKFTVVFLKMPMSQKANFAANMSDKVREIGMELGDLTKSIDLHFHRLHVKYIFPLIPSPLLKLMIKPFQTTFAISNLPGWEKLKLFHGGDVIDMFFWIPNYQNCGIGLSIFTYDNRFELGLVVDKALIDNLNDVQKILDDIFYYIDILDQQSKNYI